MFLTLAQMIDAVGHCVVAQLKALMDEWEPHANIILMAAVNSADTIDPALRRFGRFEHEIQFGLPDQTGRLQILRNHTWKMRLADDVDLEQVSRLYFGRVIPLILLHTLLTDCAGHSWLRRF
jgi:SpoVK/Ycf46/Vps4 family AAA+-type ATPase